MELNKESVYAKFIDFLQTTPLYMQSEITDSELSLICTNDNFVIEHFCDKCKTKRSFLAQRGSSFSEVMSELMKCNPSPSVASPTQTNNGFVLKKACYSTLVFECQHRCGERHSITIRFSNDGYVEKVGQYPSFAKLQVEEKLKKYKNVISKYYPELTKSVSLYSQGYGIASFVHLRRILEHLVDEKYKNLSNIQSNVKFIDKLNEVEKIEEIIPQDIVNLKRQIYSILSKGVHEYDESECLSLYESVKFVVEDILDKQITQQERKKKIAEATKAFQSKLGESNNGR